MVLSSVVREMVVWCRKWAGSGEKRDCIAVWNQESRARALE
jgi:hypothetical protein